MTFVDRNVSLERKRLPMPRSTRWISLDTPIGEMKSYRSKVAVHRDFRRGFVMGFCSYRTSFVQVKVLLLIFESFETNFCGRSMRVISTRASEQGYAFRYETLQTRSRQRLTNHGIDQCFALGQTWTNSNAMVGW